MILNDSDPEFMVIEDLTHITYIEKWNGRFYKREISKLLKRQISLEHMKRKDLLHLPEWKEEEPFPRFPEV